jgi:signal transduction histidine kinase
LERLVRSRTTALEKRGQEMEALYSADGRMLRTQTLEQVYQTLVDVAEEMLHADKSAVLTWDEKRTRLAVRVSRGFSPATVQRLKFARGEGIIGKVAENGQPVIVTNLASDSIQTDMDPEMLAAIQAEGISSFLHLPITIDNQTVAIFTVGFTRPEAFSEDTVRLFSSLVQRAALSVENAMLFEQTKQVAIMEERNRLARDLHDSAKQKAFAALAQLGAVNGMLKGGRPGVRNHLEEAENLVYEVIQELTFLIQEIHPSALKEKGLASMLREYVFQWENRNDAKANLKIENERRLPLEIEQAFYRIIQEALANITRHSRATQVEINLLFQETEISAVVSDDGCGFDPQRSPAGLGLRSIRERIESIGGTCAINTCPGEGTCVQVCAPLTPPEKE